MTATIDTPFLPIFDERQKCFRAVIEVTEGTQTRQYYCRADIDDDASASDIYDALRQQAFFQHQIQSGPSAVYKPLAA